MTVTLRLDQETRERVARIARRKRLSSSGVIRDAIAAWLEEHDDASSPYERMADLLGVVHGRNPKRSSGTGRRFTKLLSTRRNRD